MIHKFYYTLQNKKMRNEKKYEQKQPLQKYIHNYSLHNSAMAKLVAHTQSHCTREKRKNRLIVL